MIPNPADGSGAERVSTGSARRRRERRLRSMLRHERMSVAMALAARWRPGGGLHGLRPGKNSTAADVEQIIDIPARGGLQGSPPGQGDIPVVAQMQIPLV